MMEHWIDGWREQVGKKGERLDLMYRRWVESDETPGFLSMQGCISVYQSFRNALSFGKTNDKYMSTVLFVFCMQNYVADLPYSTDRIEDFPFSGIRLNSPSYSAHHNEREIVFMEGINMIVLYVEELLIDNSDIDDPFWDAFNGKTITVIYLLNAFA